MPSEWLLYQGVRFAVRQAASKQHITLTRDDTLDGGSVLPGFKVAVGELFK